MTTIVQSATNVLEQCREGFYQHVATPAADKLTFLAQYIRQSNVVGSVTPSSSFTATAITKQLREAHDGPRRILELGAGTGIFTKTIIEQMKDGDHLDVVEVVPELAAKIGDIVEASKRSEQVTIHTVGIEDFRTEGSYTHVIGALPLTYFSIEAVREYYDRIENELVAPGGSYSYVECAWFPSMKMHALHAYSLVDSSSYDKLKAIFDIKQSYLDAHSHTSHVSLLNVPPLNVVHVTH